MPGQPTPILAMSITGLWSQEEIRESFTPGPAIVLCGVVIVLLSFLWAPKGERRSYLVGLAAASFSFLSCIGVIQRFADSLCFDAPLPVKVKGFLYLPFFLGATNRGVIVLALVFFVVNFMMTAITRRRMKALTGPSFLAANVVAAACLDVAVIGAYVAVRLGYGFT